MTIPENFKPHAASRPMTKGSPYTIRASLKQVHMSAAANRHIGKPEEIALFSSETEDGDIELLFIDATKVPDFNKPTIGISKKMDSDTIRMTRFPMDIRLALGREQHEATEVSDEGYIVFTIPKQQEEE